MGKETETIVILKEQQHNLANMLQFALESSFNFKVVVCNDMNAFKTWIHDSSVKGVVYSSAGSVDNVIEIGKEVKQSEKELMSVFLDDGDEIDWDAAGVMMPDAIVKRNDCINPLIEAFEDNFVKGSSDAHEKYTRITMGPLANFENLDEDIYIKLKTGRFLKLFSEGDNVSIEDIKKYQVKGLKELYILKDAFNWILMKINSHIDKLAGDPDFKLDMAAMKQNPISENDVPDMKGPITLEKEFIETLHVKSKRLIKSMMKDRNLSKYLTNIKLNREDSAYLSNRISLMCNISCAIAQKLEWGSEATYNKLLYIIHTHDISILKYPELLKIQSLPELEASDEIDSALKDIYLKHPEESARIVDGDDRAPQDATNIILQHHELPDRSGFPKQLSAIRIQPLAAVIEMALYLSHNIIMNKDKAPVDFLPEIKELFKGGSFTKIYRALESLLT